MAKHFNAPLSKLFGNIDGRLGAGIKAVIIIYYITKEKEDKKY